MTGETVGGGDNEGDLLLLLAGVRAIVELAEGWNW